jgi:hypothetical protein
MARSSYDPLTEQVDVVTVAGVGSILSTLFSHWRYSYLIYS